MIWNSVSLMILSDLMIISSFLYLLVIYWRTMPEVKRLGFDRSLVPALGSICFISLFYLVDLYSMLVMPRFYGTSEAVNFMEYLHFNWSWVVVCFSVMALCFGMLRLLTWVIPNTNRLLRENADSNQALQEANETLKKMVAGRTLDLQESNATLRAKIISLEASEQALEQSEEKFHSLYDKTPSIFITFDNQARIVSVNQFGLNILGYEAAELIGQSCDLLFPTEDAKNERFFLQRCLDQPLDLFESEQCLTLKNGGTIWGRQTGRSMKDNDGNLFVMVSCDDISDAHDLSEQLNFRAHHDELTGLYNRRELERRLSRLLAQSASDLSKHSLLYLDLDQFKVINDTCGHCAGDELLRQITLKLQDHMRSNDILARLGGDEFALVLQHCGAKKSEQIAENLRTSIEMSRFAWGEHNFRVTASIGMVEFRGAHERVAELLSAADAACYEAKKDGRNRLHQSATGSAKVGSKHWEMQRLPSIQRALDEDRFKLYYQLITPVEKAETAALHYEILLRLDDEQGQQLSPAVFLPVAERYGLSESIDLWVIEKTLEWLCAYPRHLDQLTRCSINLSAHTISSDRALKRIIERFKALDFPAQKICFEITETAAIGRLECAQQFIQELKAIGCQFALDDFGSGLSSFGYLKNLPVDYLKIDGIFVKDIVENSIDRAMVQAINQIGHVMGKLTVAEYVENEAILKVLRELGVDYAQGFGIAHPQPLDGLLEASCVIGSNDALLQMSDA